MSDEARVPAEPAVVTTALEGCRIERVVGLDVEIVEAEPRPRAFGDRVTETLGLCLKRGRDHVVMADGKRLTYPSDTLCVRAPGCVWSAVDTGPVGFLSMDLGAALLPEGGVVGKMAFVEPRYLPNVAAVVAALRAPASALAKQVTLTALVDALLVAGVVRAPAMPRSFASRAPHAAERARALLCSDLGEPPSLEALAAAVGANRFVLLRAFRRRFGVPPHTFHLRLRVERGRALLAAGKDVAEVAHALGFSDQSHFTRVFKKVMGVPPGAYKRTLFAVRAPG